MKEELVHQLSETIRRNDKKEHKIIVDLFQDLNKAYPGHTELFKKMWNLYLEEIYKNKDYNFVPNDTFWTIDALLTEATGIMPKYLVVWSKFLKMKEEWKYGKEEMGHSEES